MQHQELEQPVDRAVRDDLSLRLMRFALVLSGDMQTARGLVEQIFASEQTIDSKNMSPSAFQFYQLEKLYRLWAGKAEKTQQTPALFRPGNEIEAIQCGLDPSIARVMGHLPSLHRALLLLIYGEKFSYAATGQLLEIGTEELMTALAGAHKSFSREESETAVCVAVKRSVNASEALHDTAR